MVTPNIDSRINNVVYIWSYRKCSTINLQQVKTISQSHANSTCNCDKSDKCKISRDFFQLVRFWLFILYFLN